MAQPVLDIGDIRIILETAFRLGGKEDKPEGTRYICLSETTVQKILSALDNVERGFRREIEDWQKYAKVDND